MARLYLIITGVFEVDFAIGLKFAEPFSRTWTTLLMFASGGLSFYLLLVSTKALPVQTAYAVWTGVGAVGTVPLGILLVGQPRDLFRPVSIPIVTGIVSLRHTSPV